MKGSAKVIELLNEVLTGELTAINQYFIHAKMCADWGYARLAQKIHHESIDEMKHADELIERILFLKGIPNVQRYGKINVGETVKEQFQLDLKLEYDAIERLRNGIALCRDEKDEVSRDMLEHILTSEEEHTDWLETQLELMEQVGEKNYLAEQIRE
ncbi:MAG: bacterioferritin [Myxococcales bacterium]|nr:bacterioferritin [Myxococcales bacterium]MCB9717756.1 bacterioferritin [Myxococcales bacterium]